MYIYTYTHIYTHSISQVALAVKNLPANVGDVKDTGSIPESRRSSGGGYGNPLPYSCLENPTERGGWWAKIHRVAKSQTHLKQLSTHTHTHIHPYKHTQSIDILHKKDTVYV